MADLGAERRALSKDFPAVEWPPAIGARIHYNSGGWYSSWTAEVRAVVDDDVAVIFKTQVGHSFWALLTKLEVDVWRDKLHMGPLPRALTKATE